MGSVLINVLHELADLRHLKYFTSLLTFNSLMKDGCPGFWSLYHYIAQHYSRTTVGTRTWLFLERKYHKWVQDYRPVRCEMKNETAVDDSAGGWGQEWWQTGGREGRGRTDSGWSPHHSLGNKPAVYGQLLICWVIIPFYPQLNQQQNNTLHKRRKAAGPTTAQNTAQRKREREREIRGEVKYARDGSI